MKNMKVSRPILMIGVIVALIPVLLAGLVWLVANPDRYREILVSEVAAHTGAKLVITEPLELQFWPAGIRLSEIVLLDTHKKVLLKAKTVSAQLKLMDMLRGNAAMEGLVINDADVFVNINKAGVNNWQPVINKVLQGEPASMASLQARKIRISLHHEDGSQDVSIDADKILLSNLDQPESIQLESEFLVSRLDSQGGNLLLQNTVKGRLEKQEEGWLLRDNRVTSIVSSTYLPGQISVDFQGGIQFKGEQIEAPSFKTVLLYRNLTMPQPDQATLSGRMRLDRSESSLSLMDVAFRSSGKNAAQLKAKTLSGNWKTNTVSAEALSFSAFFGGHQFAQPESKPLDVSAQINRKENGWEFEDVILGSGESRLLGNAKVSQGEEVRAYTLKFEGKSLQADDVAPLIGIKGLSGVLDFKAEIESSGNNWAAFWENGKGTVSLKLGEGVLEGKSMAAILWEKLDNYRKLLPDLAEVSPVQEKGTVIKRLVLENKLDQGVIKTRIVQAEIGAFNVLTLKGEGEYDMRSATLEYDGNLKIDKAFFTGMTKPYEMPFECRANLSEGEQTFLEGLETGCGMSQAAKRETLTKALRQRFLGSPAGATPHSEQ